MGRLAAFVIAVGAGVAVWGGVAQGDVVPNADLALVSYTTDVAHARIGDEVTFTVVATNRGPEPAELDTVVNLPDTLGWVSNQCDRGISADGQFCEYGILQPGETVTSTAVAEVLATNLKTVSGTACVLSEQVISDPDTSNDCASTSVKIVGKRS
jgi:uncharacterized repeat protein (TIGR01451 family)